MKIISIFNKPLAKALIRLVNLTISQGQYPNNLKITRVIPILKPQKEPTSTESYRFINLTPAIGKLIDKTIQTQLTHHLIENQLLSHHHHGNVRGCSTTTALTTLIDTWATNMQAGHDITTLLVDQSSTFDLIQHNILIQKMEVLGLNPKSLSLMTTYLQDRQQAVPVEGFTSTPLHCHNLSVIQGSGLSCLLYLIYTLDLPQIFTPQPTTLQQDAKNTTTTEATLYVDDTTVNIYNDKQTNPQEDLDTTMNTKMNYMEQNKLVMNK